MALDSCEAFSLALAGSRNSSASPDDLIQERNHRLELFGPIWTAQGARGSYDDTADRQWTARLFFRHRGTKSLFSSCVSSALEADARADSMFRYLEKTSSPTCPGQSAAWNDFF